jgi:putative lipoprotein
MRHLALIALLVIAGCAGWPAFAGVPPGLAEAVRAQTHGREIVAPSFKFALVDLNDDGVLDAVVLITDRCGSGGCNMLILRGTAGGFTVVSGSTITNEPIKVSPELHHGWHTLLVSVRGGGVQPGLVLMRFNGTKFPLNPTVQPRATQAQADSATALVFQNGATP